RERADRLVGGEVPERDQPTDGPGGQDSPVATEGDAFDRAGFGSERAEFPARGDFPEPDGAVEAAGRQHASAGWERAVLPRAAMPLQRPPVAVRRGPALEVGPLEAPQVGLRRAGALAVEQFADAGRVPLVERAPGLADIEDVSVATDLIEC